MPQLKWSELELLECFEVLPEVSEYETSHAYIIHRAGLNLKLLMKQYDSRIQLTLFRDVDSNILEIDLWVRGQVRRIHHKHGSYIELQDCIFIRGYVGYVNTGSAGTTVVVDINPDISIAMVPFAL